MYNRFKILSAKPVLGEKVIVIESNYEISALSVTHENIRITNPGDPLSELLWKDFLVNGRTITLFLTSEPLVNQPYIVRVQGLKNIIDDTLDINYKQSIEFKSYVTSEITFTAPNMHSVVPRLEIKIKEDVLENKSPADYFVVQISNDPLFQTELLAEQDVYNKQVTFDIDYQGQVFVRCKAHYITGDEQMASCFGNWITTTCMLSESTTNSDGDNNQNNVSEIELKALKTPVDIQTKGEFSYVFDIKKILDIGSISVSSRPLLGDESSSSEIAIDSYLIFNKVTIIPSAPLPSNHLITFSLKDVQLDGGAISNYSHSFYSFFDPIYASFSDIKSILNADIELDQELVYYHLIEASKLADYFADIKLNSAIKNYRYYQEVDYAYDFEKNMFVKYYAAGQIFSQIRSSIVYDMSFSGKLGEIEVSPKASLPDLSAFLKELSSEAEKWKLALQGYKAHVPEARSAIKSKSCLPHNHYRGGR